MSGQMILIGVLGLVFIGFIGFANYRSAVERGKKIYCDVHCKDESSCDFMSNSASKF